MPDPDPPPGRPAGRDGEPLLPERSVDDSDRGWGEDVSDPGDRGDGDREAWLRRERPPHHGT